MALEIVALKLFVPRALTEFVKTRVHWLSGCVRLVPAGK